MPHGTFETNAIHLDIQGSSLVELAIIAKRTGLLLNTGIDLHCELCDACREKWIAAKAVGKSLRVNDVFPGECPELCATS